MRMITRTAVALGLGAVLALGPAATALASSSDDDPNVLSADQIDLDLVLDGVDLLGLGLGDESGKGLDLNLEGALERVVGLVNDLVDQLLGDDGDGALGGTSLLGGDDEGLLGTGLLR